MISTFANAFVRAFHITKSYVMLHQEHKQAIPMLPFRLVLQRLLLSHWCQLVEMQVHMFLC